MLPTKCQSSQGFVVLSHQMVFQDIGHNIHYLHSSEHSLKILRLHTTLSPTVPWKHYHMLIPSD